MDNDQFKNLRDVLDGVVTWLLQVQESCHPSSLLSEAPRAKSHEENLSLCQSMGVGEAGREGGMGQSHQTLEKEFPRQVSMEEGTPHVSSGHPTVPLPSPPWDEWQENPKAPPRGTATPEMFPHSLRCSLGLGGDQHGWSSRVTGWITKINK